MEGVDHDLSLGHGEVAGTDALVDPREFLLGQLAVELLAEVGHDQFIFLARESEQPMPFDQLEQKEATGFLLRIVATLPPRQQEVIQLKFQNDLSYQQIAKIMKTTANNVGVLLHTALKTLRQRYGEIARDFIPFKPRTTE